MDLNRFKILTHLDNDAKAHSEVLFKDMTKGEIDVPMEGDNKARFGIIKGSRTAFTYITAALARALICTTRRSPYSRILPETSRYTLAGLDGSREGYLAWRI